MVNKSVKKEKNFAVFIVIMFSVVILGMPVMAGQGDFPVIRWECLGLTYNQQARIKALDAKWQRINRNLRARIIDDQKTLKYLLANPYSTDKEIREMHDKLLMNKKMLRAQAMENFLQKRNVLTPAQRKNLHQIISR